ncbi:MAG TPA: flavin reductase family protein [Desulfobulbaceae bacterium]|nr:flavin reductase family protein [Desulfobulbaceae bacterium]
MNIDLARQNAAQIYSVMAQTIIPRPIAWVLSENANGSFNLAPFSYFAPICSNPPLVMISISKKPDGTLKDTRANIKERKDFVLHIPSREQLEPMNASAATMAAGVSEVEELGLGLTGFEGSRLPRIKDSRVAMACSLYEIKEIGKGPYAMILGRIHHIYITDAAILEQTDEKTRIAPEQLNPIGRLGGPQYAELGRIITLARPE